MYNHYYRHCHPYILYCFADQFQHILFTFVLVGCPLVILKTTVIELELPVQFVNF